jgi:NAD(P)-dependent dehydrogenase (short-subunit alcohol dehydrogenase family)
VAAFKTIADHFPGGVDILVSNAGSLASSGQYLASCDSHKWWENDLTTNIRGTMLLTRNFLSLPSTITRQKPRKRYIVYITSGTSFIVNPGESGYSLSKLSITQMAAFAHAESTGSLTVQAIAVHPGIFATDMMDDMYHFYAKDTPELAGAVINWAATDQAEFMSGRYTTANVSSFTV